MNTSGLSICEIKFILQTQDTKLPLETGRIIPPNRRHVPSLTVGNSKTLMVAGEPSGLLFIYTHSHTPIKMYIGLSSFFF